MATAHESVTGLPTTNKSVRTSSYTDPTDVNSPPVVANIAANSHLVALVNW